MKKKSQQTFKHKPPNIFDLATKVFLALLMIVTTTFTGIAGTSGIDLAEPASANSNVWLYTFKLSGGYNEGESGVTNPAIPKNGTFTVKHDANTNAVTLSHKDWAFTQWGFTDSNNYRTVVNQYPVFNKTQFNVSSTGAQLLNGLSVSSSVYIYYAYQNKMYDGTAMDNGMTLGVTLTSKVQETSGGGSCGGSTASNIWLYTFKLSGGYNEGESGVTNPAIPKNGNFTLKHNANNNAVELSHMNWAFTQWGFTDSNNYRTVVNQYPVFNKKQFSATSSGAQLLNGLTVSGSIYIYYAYQNMMYDGTGMDNGGTYYATLTSKVQETSSGGGSCGGTTPAPTPPPTTVTKTVYPKTCASGLTPKGTPGTSSFYCEKPVKQTEIKNPDFIKDINLGDIIAGMGDYGSTGDRGDGQFNLDSGNHNNGWYLNGAGDNYKSDHIQFTNVPDNGYVNAIGNSWSPEYLITQGKNKIEVPVPSDATTVDKQKRDTELNNFKATNSLSEVLAYQVTDLDALKTMQETDKGLTDLFTKSGSVYKYGTNVVSHKVDQTGEGNYSDFKINEGDYYILASKYTDMVGAKKESATPSQTVIDKYTYYSFIPVSVNFMTDLSYLPVYNNLLTQVNDKMLMTGNQKANHKLGNLKYGSYDSLKVPSAYNHEKGNTIIGSTSGGIQLLNRELNPVTITGETSIASTAKVSDVVEYNNGFYIATDVGILYLNCKDNSLSKTTVTDSVNDLMLSHNTMHILTDTTLRVAFVGEGELIMSSKEYDLKELFSDASVKAGRIEEVNGLLNISSKDDGSLSEVITLTK